MNLLKKIPPTSSAARRTGATPASLFLLGLISLLVLTGAGNLPVQNFKPVGPMQADLNAGAHNITNAATVSATNFAITGGGNLPALDTNGLLPIDVRTANLDNQSIVFEGDSLTAGNSVTSAAQIFATLAQNLPFLKNHGTVYNDAVGGSYTLTGTNSGNNTTDRYVANVKPHRPTANGGTGGLKSILIYLSGTNDLANGTSATALISSLTAYATQARADGFVFYLGTIPPRSNGYLGWTSADDVQRQLVNQAIRNGTITSDGVIDWAAYLSNPADTTVFGSGGLHPTPAANVLMASILNTGLTSGGFFPRVQEGNFEAPINVNGSVTAQAGAVGPSFISGSLEAQGFLINHVWYGDNLYYNGTNFIYQNTGYGGILNFDAGGTGYGLITRFAVSGTGGATASTYTTLKADYLGNFALGSNVNPLEGTFSGAGLFFNGTNNDLILNNTNTDDGVNKLQVNGSIRQTSVTNASVLGADSTGKIVATTALASTLTATTQAAGDNSTKLATTAFVTTALGNLTSIQRFSPTTSGFTIAASSTAHLVIDLTPSGTLASCPITLPTGGFDGQFLRLVTSQSITFSFTGAASSVTATSIPANTGLNLVWDATAAKWRQD